MATIPASAVEAYRDALGAVSVQARSRARALVRAWCAAHPGDVAGAREYAREAVAEVVSRYGDAAAESACMVYDELAAQAGADVPAAEVDNEPDAGQIERVARYQARKLVDGDAEGFAEAMASYASYAARNAAQSTVESNCRRDRVRYARVPSGAETCPWCTMLASRGFVYYTADTARHASHRHCDCVVMPGFDGLTDVEGYDTAALYERYMADVEEGRISLGASGGGRHGRRSPMSHDDVSAMVEGARTMDELREVCSELSVAAQEGRITRAQVSGIRSMIARRRRDLESVKLEDDADFIAGYLDAAAGSGRISYGKPFESFSNEDGERDLFAHAALVRSGRIVEVRAEDAPEGFSNIDLTIDGDPWELKSPDGGNIRAVESNLRKAKRQFSRTYPVPTEKVRVVFNGRYLAVDDETISREIARRMGQHGIAEVIQVRKDGSVDVISK